MKSLLFRLGVPSLAKALVAKFGAFIHTASFALGTATKALAVGIAADHLSADWILGNGCKSESQATGTSHAP